MTSDKVQIKKNEPKHTPTACTRVSACKVCQYINIVHLINLK